MSGLTLYDVAIPTFTNGLKTFDHILTKAETHAKENGLDANAEYPEARLIADQNPLIFQVQNATRAVKANVDRLTGVESKQLTFLDKEKTFEDLHARIRATLEFLKTVDRKKVDARADETVNLPVAGKHVDLPLKTAVLGHGIPNFIFHITTGYSILRAKGVPLGKADFIVTFVGL